MNAANLLTLLRLVLVPFVILAILDGRHTLALALFAGAAFTDVLDGAVARRFRLATSAGAWLDLGCKIFAVLWRYDDKARSGRASRNPGLMEPEV